MLATARSMLRSVPPGMRKRLPYRASIADPLFACNSSPSLESGLPSRINITDSSTLNNPRLEQRRMLSFSYPAPRTLDEVVKTDLLESETSERIKEIWDEYHLVKEDVVGETWSIEDYNTFRGCAQDSPMFVYPIKRPDNTEFVMLSQVQEKHCLLTFLDEYKLDPLGAAPWLSVTFYDDLAEDKGIVLVRGDVSVPKLTRPEGLHLIKLIKKYYLENPEMVDCFNNRPSEFDVMAHLSSCPQLEQPSSAGEQD